MNKLLLSLVWLLFLSLLGVSTFAQSKRAARRSARATAAPTKWRVTVKMNDGKEWDGRLLRLGDDFVELLYAKNRLKFTLEQVESINIEPSPFGVPPQMALTPQIIMPNPEPPKMKTPSLFVPEITYDALKSLPPMRGPVGEPPVPAPLTSGSGIGRGIGTGVGRSASVKTEASTRLSLEEDLDAPVNTPVRLRYREKAPFTEQARTNKTEGEVELKVIFHASGIISDIKVVRSLPDGLTDNAIKAAKNIRFVPATRRGKPVSVRGTLIYSFNRY